MSAVSRPGAGNQGDWSYVASFTFAIVLLALTALAVDAEAVAYARARLWAAVSVAARAGARCLAPVQGGPAPACVGPVVDQLMQQNLAAARMSLVTVQATLPTVDSVKVVATASIPLPFAIPGAADPIAMQSQATALLLPAPTSSP